MEELRLPLIKPTVEFGHLARSRLSEDPKSLDSPKLLNNLNLISSNTVPRMSSPIYRFHTSDCKNTNEIIKELSSNIQEIFPKVINCPYSFADVKIFQSETHAFAVTNEGYCVFVDIVNNTFDDVHLSENALSLVLLCQNDSLAFAKERDFGKIYCLELPSMNLKKVLKIQGESTTGIGKMCLSPDEKYLYARLWKGEIVRWEVAGLGNYLVLYSDRNINCMNISPDGIAVVGTTDRKIILFSLSFQKISEKTFDFVVDAYICFSNSGNFILLGMEKAIKVIDKETLMIEFDIKVDSQANDCRMTEDNRFIIAALDSGALVFYDTRFKNKEYCIRIHDSSIKTIHLTVDQSKIYTFGADFKLSHVKFPRLTLFRTLADSDKNHEQPLSIKTEEVPDDNNSFTSPPKQTEPNLFKPLCIVQGSSPAVLIAGGESNKIYLFDSDKKKIGELVGHQDYVYSLVILSEKILASGSADHTILVWNYIRKEKVSALIGHIGPVTALAKIDANRLASGSEDGTIKIWDWESNLLLYTISEILKPIVALLLIDASKLLVGLSSVVQCWDLESYCMIFEKLLEVELKSLRLIESNISDSKRIFVGLGLEGNDLWMENPFSCTDVNYYGPDEGRTYEFLTYIREMMMGKLPNYDNNMDLWMVSPYKINVLHFYAYFNIPEYLGQSIVNGVPLINSICNSNPLSIALEMNHKECVEIIIKSVWKRYPFSPYLLSVINNESILKLNKTNTYILPKFYKAIITKPYSCPRHCSNEVKLPLIYLNCQSTLIPKFLVREEDLSSSDQEIRFLQSIVPLNLYPGSSKSIEFLTSLKSTTHDELYTTEALQFILDYKFAKIKKVLFAELGIFFLYFAMLLAWNVLELASDFNSYLFYGLAGTGGLVTLFNLFYCAISKSLNLWTVLDILRSISLGLFIVADKLSTVLSDYKQLLIIVLISLSFLQGFYYFKFFSKSRKALQIGVDLVKDSVSLILLLSYISLSVFIASLFTDDLNAGSSMFLISISNIDLPLIQTISICLIFVSLLAICTHNYDQNDGKERIQEYKEIFQLVIKGEHLMIWNRKQNLDQYLQACAVNEFIGVEKIKKISRRIKEVKEVQAQNHYEVIEGFGEIKEKLEGMSLLIKEIKTEKRGTKKRNTLVV